MKGNSLGVMIDCSRNAVMTVASLKEFIFTISKMGYNTVQLYTEDTYEVENEPLFGYMRGAYTGEEIKDIDNYCKSLGIELVPCIQTLAHLNCIFRWYPELNDTSDILLIDDDRVYELIENMFKTIRRNYSTDKVHIGMDEAFLVGCGKYMGKHGYTDRTELLLKHLNKVCKIAEKYSFKPMMWSDMFFRLASGGDYYTKLSDKQIAKVKNLIPENVSLVYWDYYNVKSKIYSDMITAHKKMTDKVIFAGGAWKWKGFVPDNAYSIKTMKSAFPELVKNGVDEVLITMWGDNGAECPVSSVLPSLMVAAEFYKGNFSMKDIKEKFYNIVGVSFDDFMKLDILDELKDGHEGFVNPSKYMLYSDCFYGYLDYTVQEGKAKLYEKYAKMLSSRAKKAGEYALIFENESALAKVLSVKYDLGYRTRKAYLGKDKKTLIELQKDYKKTIVLLEKFYEKFKVVWDKYNKPFGFEVQDARLGGLIMRIKHCLSVLTDYCDGKIDRIEGLDKPLQQKQTGVSICCNAWSDNISTAVV